MNTQNLSPLYTSCPLDTTDDLIQKKQKVEKAAGLLQTMSKSNNNQAHKESQSRTQHIAALRAMDVVISAGLDLRIKLWVILKQVTTLSDIEAATILLLDPNSLQLEQIISHSTPATRSLSAQWRQIDAQEAIIEKKTVKRATKITQTYRRQAKIKHSREGRERLISYLAIPLLIGNEVKGVLEVFKHTSCEQELVSLAYLSMLAEEAALAIHHANLPQSFAQAHQELTDAYDVELLQWANAVERHENQSIGDTEQMANLTVQLAQQMGLSEPEQLYIRWGALLHDIGHIGIPDKLLKSTKPLSPQEWDRIRHHPTYAYQMLDPISYLQRALDIPYCHHEKWDGTGYPRGLKGEEIPLAARIFAVIDVWTALRSERPYRQAWSDQDAEYYIREQAGKQFDPTVVDAFLKMRCL